MFFVVYRKYQKSVDNKMYACLNLINSCNVHANLKKKLQKVMINSLGKIHNTCKSD
jgi:hypothetical protein